MLNVCLSVLDNQETALNFRNVYIGCSPEDPWAWVIDYGSSILRSVSLRTLVVEQRPIEIEFFRLEVSRGWGKGVILNPRISRLEILLVGEKQMKIKLSEQWSSVSSLLRRD